MSKLYLETHGCQMNVADSERAVKTLRAEGIEIVCSPNEADIILLNTCSVRARAELKVFNRIGQIKKVGSRRRQVFGVMGCVAQLEKEKLFGRKSAIDFVVGTHSTAKLSEVVNRVLGGEQRVLEVGVDNRSGEADILTPADRESKSVAFVPIIEGCNKFCSYCIVPFSRGREISKTASQVVAEVEALKASGFCEVQLIGQNVNSYRPKTNDGIEHLSGATPFVKLLKAVAATKIERIKYTTSFPRDFHTEIIEVMCEHANICNWVHLPVQSGSDAVLKRMRRGYSSNDYLEKVFALKNASRSIALTTDIIIGFPGETDNDFEQTVELVKKSRFHSTYIYNYSQRAGTKAAQMDDDVPLEEKKRRFHFLQQVQEQIQSEIYNSYLDTTQSVLVKGRSSRSMTDAFGHSTCNKVVNFVAPQDVTDRIVDVRITQVKHNSLYGEMKHSAAEKNV